jgi:hypothetical protein
MNKKRLLWYLIVLLFCLGLIVAPANTVFANQSTQADMPLEKVVIPAANAKSEASIIKVFPSNEKTIVYLQCGHVVGKVVPAGCGCSSGGWRYTSECPKSETIYLPLPCYRRKP